MRKHNEEMVSIEAGPVTLTGERDLVSRILAAGPAWAADVGLSRAKAHARPMSRDEDHVMTGVYVGVGILLAAGAGYLAWRYLLSDEQKTHAMDLVADTTTKAKRVVRDAKGKLTA